MLATAMATTATETGKYASAAVAILAALLETEKTTIPTPMRDVLDAASKAAGRGKLHLYNKSARRRRRVPRGNNSKSSRALSN